MTGTGEGLENDRRWLEAFRAGERWALEEVYRRYADATARMLRAALRESWRRSAMRDSDFELEQALSEVFARAFEPRARLAYDGVHPYQTFLFGIARNSLRERGRLREDAAGTGEEVAELADPPAADPERASLAAELDALLVRFLEALPPEQRRLYDLRFVQEQGQEAAAAALGWTRIQLRRRELALKRALLEALHRAGYLTEIQHRGWRFSVPRSTGGG